METIITPEEKISKFFEEKRLDFMSSVPQKRMKEIILSSGLKGHSGKTIDYGENGEAHRTTYGHFLSKGKWDEGRVSLTQKRETMKSIAEKSEKSGEAIYVRVDDTISEKKQPSSKSKRPTEGTGWHYSHLENELVFGHQILGCTVSCGEMSLSYEMKRYDKSRKSKIDMTLDIVAGLPVADSKSFALFDSWYTNSKTVNAFKDKNYIVIGALKTNRIIYPDGNNISISDFAANLSVDKFHLVTVDSQEKYWSFRYVGNLNGIFNVAVLITYPQGNFGDKRALRAFICSDASIDDSDILNHYAHRWQIETFFKQMKGYFGLDKFMFRSAVAIDRFHSWSLAYFFFVIVFGCEVSFSAGVKNLRVNFVHSFKFAH